MAAEEVSVIALVENLELTVPHRLPSPNPGTLVRDLTAKAADQNRRPTSTNVINLGNRESQNALKRHLNLHVYEAGDVEKSNDPSDTSESLEILQRLPRGTVIIKQVEDTTPKSSTTNEETPESTLSVLTDKIKKSTQRWRNKRTLEVRRNPLRSAARKDFKDCARITTSRQRLLAGRKRAAATATATSDSTPNGSTSSGNKNSQDSSNRDETPATISKRSRAGNYMNTRSVTKKMHNVGATYEAPTLRDFVEWKEWPVHGMHERPVYHPQFGLVTEYYGRIFASFNDEGYQEIGSADNPQVEIVRVDPRVDSLDSAYDFNQDMSFQAQTTVPSQFTAAAAAAMQKLGYGPLRNSLLAGRAEGISRILDLEPVASSYETLNSNYGHIQQQQLQQHHMERLQQLESLGQRIQNARAFLQQPNKASTNTDQQKLETLQQRIQNSRALLQQQQSSSEAASSGNLQFENLKLRIQNARARLQQPSLTSTSAGQKHLNLTSGPVISKEMFKNLQNATFAKNSTQQSPSKCLMTPRAPATTAVTMPFCTVQASNSKNKLVFVRAPDVPKKPSVEKTSTITSSTQSMTQSWGEKTLQKFDPSSLKLCSPFIEVPPKKQSLLSCSNKLDFLATTSSTESLLTYPKRIINNKNKICASTSSSDGNRVSLLSQQLGRYFTPANLAEPASIFRPSNSLLQTPKLKDDLGLNSAMCNGVDFEFEGSTESIDDHLSEVLDLSKKEPLKVKLEEAKVKDDKNGILVECC